MTVLVVRIGKMIMRVRERQVTVPVAVPGAGQYRDFMRMLMM